MMIGVTAHLVHRTAGRGRNGIPSSAISVVLGGYMVIYGHARHRPAFLDMGGPAAGSWVIFHC